MKKLTVVLLMMALFIPFITSCTKVTTGAVAISPDLATELESIPADYGNLIAVTNTAQYPEWFQMWFEDEAGTIRVVRIQLFDNLIHRDTKVYPRSQPAGEES